MSNPELTSSEPTERFTGSTAGQTRSDNGLGTSGGAVAGGLAVHAAISYRAGKFSVRKGGFGNRTAPQKLSVEAVRTLPGTRITGDSRLAWISERSNEPVCKTGGLMPTQVRILLHALRRH